MNDNGKTRVGIVGVGGIANGVHIPGYLQSPDSVITAICDVNESALERGAKRCDIPAERCFKDYRDLVACDEVDVVDICTPNYIHCEIAAEAINHRKPFSVEKPMGMNYAETKRISDLATQKKVPGMVCFSWRYRPYPRFMKTIIDRGEIGDLYHIYIRCIKNSGLVPGRRLEWRFDKTLAGTGVLGDLASHMFDFTRFLGQEFKSVAADAGIIIKQRQKLNSDEIAEVTTDDWCNILATMESGVNATYQISRCATHVGDLIQLEFYGKKGKIIYTYDEGNQTLEICKAGTEAVRERRFVEPSALFDAVQSQAFINVVKGVDDGFSATIEDGIICQRILDATLKAVETKRWVDVSEVY
jgi:predicted dehydrogenase